MGRDVSFRKATEGVREMDKRHNKGWLFGMLIPADLLLSWGIFFICDMLSWRIGPDIVVYENWFGDLDNPVRYRFGTGSVELLLALLQAFLFVWVERKLYKKEKVSRMLTRIAIALHILNFLIWVLFYIEWNGYVTIPEIWLPQYMVQRIMYGW